MSDSLMAFSIALMLAGEESKGEMSRVVDSGTVMAARDFRGVGVSNDSTYGQRWDGEQ